MSAVVRHDRLDGFAALLMLGLTMTWGFNQVAIKIGNAGFNPLAVAVFRSALGGLLVASWCRFKGIPLLAPDRTLVPGLIAGVLFGAEFALIFLGLDFTTAARGALMVNTMPFFVAAGAHLLLGERLSGRKVAGMVLAFETPWYIDGLGGFIIEDQILITAEECEVMAPSPRNLIVL